jgi:hypothetical protein
MIILTFERSIRAEVVTYLHDAAFGSLHTQQLHGFDELRNDQGIIQNRSAKTNTTPASLYLPASSFSFQIRRLAKKSSEWKMAKNYYFLAVRMEAKITWIRVFHVKQCSERSSLLYRSLQIGLRLTHDDDPRQLESPSS